MPDLYPELLSSNPDAAAYRKRNARLILTHICRLQPGETVAILMGKRELHTLGPNILDCRALAEEAAALGAYPFTIDLDEFSHTPYFKTNRGLPALASLVKADVVIGSATYFKRLGFGEHDSFDKFLIGDLRWVDLQKGMDRWEITAEDIDETRRNTERLCARLADCKTVRVTNPAGTDFTFAGLHYTPILGILPCYGEVAIIPKIGSGTGRIVVEGPTQRKVRPKTETDRTPLVIECKDGKVLSADGDGEQVERFRTYMQSQEPHGDVIDEVGIPTTRIESNNACWDDGTHNCYTIHIAVGNNQRKDELVHGLLHMDMEILSPTLWIDGEIVMENREFKLS